MSNFMNILLDMSLVGSYCILIVLFLRLLLRKAPRIFSYLLWGVVFLRLALPIFPEAPVSLVPQAVRSFSVTSYFSAGENEGNMNLVPTDIDAGSAVSSEAVKNSPELVQATQENQDVATAPSNWTETVLSGLASRNNISQAFSIVWCTGIVLLASYNLIAYLRLRRRLTDAVIEDGFYISDRITSPFVLGLLRPRIYLPVGLSPEERSFVVLHEKSHLRRQDPVIKLLAFLVTCLHWFNPFAWIAFLLFSRDIETSCDESVVRNLSDSSRKSYSSTLLAVASGRNRLRPMPLAFGEGDLKGRIRGILNYKKPAIWLIGLAVVAVVVTSIGLLMNPMSSDLFNAKSDGTEGSTNSSLIETSETTSPSESSSSLTSETTTPSESGSSLPSETTPSDSGSVPTSTWSDELPNWSASTPVDPNEFESIFTKNNYKVTKVDTTDEADAVYQAVSASGSSLITCTVYPNTDVSYRKLDEYLTEIYADYTPDGNSYSPSFGVYPNYFAAYDLPAYPNFRAVFLSGTVILDVRFRLEMSEIFPYMHAAQEFGFGDASINFEAPIPELPEEMILGTQEELAEILASENMTLEKYTNSSDVYVADSEDNSVRVVLSRFDLAYSTRLDLVMSLYAQSQEVSTYQGSYQITDSYRCFSWSSAEQETYGIQVDQSNGWYLAVVVSWSEDPTTEAAQRAYAEELLKKLCFPDSLT